MDREEIRRRFSEQLCRGIDRGAGGCPGGPPCAPAPVVVVVTGDGNSVTVQLPAGTSFEGS